MKPLLLTLTLLSTLTGYGQDADWALKRVLTGESKVRVDSTYCHFYILNNQDTCFFTDNSTVMQCNFLQTLDRDHNKCVIYINGEPGNGIIEILRRNRSEKKTTSFKGSIANGLMIDGTYTVQNDNGLPMLTGQYLNNWKYGQWTSFYPDGHIESILKYVEGANDPVEYKEFN